MALFLNLNRKNIYVGYTEINRVQLPYSTSCMSYCILSSIPPLGMYYDHNDKGNRIGAIQDTIMLGHGHSVFVFCF